MSEKRIVPSNMMAWPPVRDLLPDQKLIIYHLSATAPADCGCWLMNTAAFSADLSLREPALLDALNEFEKRGLIAQDKGTGEIFICHWFRWHTFKGIRLKMLFASFERIESEYLRERVRIAAARNGVEINESLENQGGNQQTKPTQTILNKTTTPLTPLAEGDGFGGGGAFDLEGLVQAALWAERRSGREIRSIPGWTRKVKERLQKGVTEQDLATLDEYHDAMKREADHLASLDSARAGPRLDDHAAAEAMKKGEELLKRRKK